MKSEIRIAGIGGQGLVSASVVLAEALGVVRDFQVVQTQFYASNITGGASCGDVVVADENITFPWVLEPDLLIALAQDAVDGHGAKMRPGTTVIADDIMVTNLSLFGEDVTVHWAPLTRTADEVGSRRCANIVALGALSQLTGLLDLAQVSKAVASRAPGKPETNRRAVEAGYALQLTPAEGRAA
ncbi:MAG: 2-oxoacid:ferredoxin oxidoreductase subunit gamma [Rhodospirillaceae bacterium]|jgi:2-oxoglutarate ferredoxin oxidoreductase subunit gamma|nr:2-oxoacid:ferredoxin oxidoreductase subunit gamma [Rhodospirillaceae bacterium]MBT3495424.1 2-oxoacid:ferredoxin oxidoreductase subunit gamma [Rhodospirillaceae bacterium]MBT3780146.1 2-oxoacid:ferredoxin oxidoreductase subunit gamma [Rhodospirillaceae bacterium]MBT3975533.1 2-oxoacid:ferredoxin oxidoreductase subunit gamma [Rhodospirillaceae bacterium]MBT4168016.1 2-oxoacid:ferredoxin oxidoreductase subunit gamma [Rhodospirillaceae bacterium]